MFHITVWKSPDLTVIISLCLPLPPHRSTFDLLFLFSSTLLSSSIPSVYFTPLSSYWVISSFLLRCRNHVWNLILSVRLHQTRCSQGAPLLSIRPRHSTSPVRPWRVPRGIQLALLFFVSTFSPTLVSLFPSIFLLSFILYVSPQLSLQGFSSRLFNLFSDIIAPLAKCDTTSIFPV